jgi:nucleoside 2-deoxyribosyltransferase
MKASDFLEALQTFFLDFIGAIIPGSVLLAGLIVATNGVDLLRNMLTAVPNLDWLVLLITTYVLGNLSVGIGDLLTLRWLYKIRNELLEHPSVVAFHKATPIELPTATDVKSKASTFGTLRNIALSFTDEAKATTYRFMFIALFHLGTAVSLCLSLIVFWGTLLARLSTPALQSTDVDWLLIVVLTVAVLLASSILTLRWREFYERAMRLPFPAALASLSKSETQKGDTEQCIPSSIQDKSLQIYLAGGFHSGWHEGVQQQVKQVSFIDPRSHSLENERQYTTWDLLAIRRSDVVFAYAEEANPALYALSLEVGYARALGKHILLVEEHPTEQRRRYFGMLRACADVTFSSLDEAVQYLRSLSATPPAQEKDIPPE